MPGNVLGVQVANPKRGAVQFDARRIDGVIFHIPSGAGVTSAPIGSIVTLQEDANGKQFIVLGAAAYSGSDEYGTCTILLVGFLEAATQQSANVNQTVGSYSDGDIAAIVSDGEMVAMCPYQSANKPSAGATSYITPAGLISSASSGNVAFPGVVFYGTAGIQNTGQLKTGYVFARLSGLIKGI